MNLKRYDTDETAVPYESPHGVWVDANIAVRLYNTLEKYWQIEQDIYDLEDFENDVIQLFEEIHRES